MKINSLNLKGFGKFENKQIKLKDGLNLIYGSNESGKTTVHKFIEGMLFGFYKEGKQNRLPEDELEKYEPWIAKNYSGSMEYESESGTYLVQRKFSKGSDSVEIKDPVTGKDVTDKFGVSSVTRLSNYALEDLNLTKSIYRNSVSISKIIKKK